MNQQEPVMTSQEQWAAVHEALLHELRWRMAGKDLLITQDRASDLVDNLADVVNANFVLTPPATPGRLVPEAPEGLAVGQVGPT